MRSAVLLLACGAALGLGGCTRQLGIIETNTNTLVAGQERLERRLEALHSEVIALRTRDQEREQDYIERRAELENQLRQLDAAVRRTTARSDEQEALLREVLAALDLLARQQPLPAADNPSATDEKTTDSGDDAVGSTTRPQDSAATAADSSSVEAVVVQGGSPGKDVFDAAWADYTRGDYEIARDGFQEVVDRFGDSELADDAAYWVAETWYAQHDYEKAQAEFDRVLTLSTPSDDIVTAAMLKLAYSLLENGDQERAISVLQALRNEYPDSDEALIAGHKLSTLGGGPDSP